MDPIILILLAISLVLFFGFFASFVFRKFNVPDILFLIILGFVIGPYCLKYVSSESVSVVAPVLTIFTLFFLLFDGGFNINLSSLIKEFFHSFVLTLFNFIISTIIVAGVMYYSGFSILISLLTGFLLGGVSSSFAIPILQQLKISKKVYSLLSLESALTDIFCIVFSLSVIEIINLGSFGVRSMITQLISLFAVAALVGLIGGILWIILILRVFKEHNYMMVLAVLILIYVTAEFLHGNGAIAALFFGIILNNSKQLSSIIKGILSSKAKEKKKALKGDLGISVTTPSEEYFYHQVTFLLKAFFFVYVGLLIDLSDWRALAIGGILSILLMISRMASLLLTRKRMDPLNRSLVDSIFARGLAAAVIAQLAVQMAVPYADFIAKVAYVVITGTIVLSSARVFWVKRKIPNKGTA